jgi:hypothetical protein
LALFKLPLLLRITPFLLYIVVVALFLPRFAQDMSVDGVSYIGIARHYLAGEWGEAVNGFWSPLISWLLALLLGCGLSPDIAFKTITISSGLLALFANGLLVAHCIRNRKLGLIVQCSAAVMLASFAMIVCTPDIVGLAFFLLYVGTLIKCLSTQRKLWAVTSGVILLVTYFAKTFFFPFGVCIAFLYPTVGFFLYRSRQKLSRDISSAVLICCVAVVLGTPWVIAIKAKYDSWTIGTAGRSNFNRVMNSGTRTQVLPPKTAISPFEDPTLGALSSHTAVHFGTIVNNLARNFTGITSRTLRHYPLLIVGVMLAIVTLHYSRRLYWRNPLAIGLAVVVLWCSYSAVCAFVPQQAYTWAGDIFILIITAVGIEQSGVIRLCRKQYAITALTLIFTLMWTGYPVAEMLVRKAQGVAEKKAGTSLRKYVEGKLVVSDSLFNENLVACFWALAKYRGQYPNELYLENIGDADFFLRWNEHSHVPQGFRRITSVDVDLGRVEVWERAR